MRRLKEHPVICTCLVLLTSLFTSSLAASPPALCTAVSCPPGLAVNSALVAISSTCVCTSAISASLCFSSAPSSPLSASDASSLQQSLADALQLSSSQVSINATSSPCSSVLIFRPDELQWNLVDVSVIINRLLTNASIAPPSFGSTTVASAALLVDNAPPQANSVYYSPGAPTVFPPPPYSSPPSSSNSIAWWGILLIVLAVLILLLLVGGAAWLLLLQRQSGTETTSEKKEETKSITFRGKRPGTATRPKTVSQSEFGLKVQENFVKALSLEEVMAATQNFSEDTTLGSGGYGTVYRGEGPGGVAWAVKRAKNANEEGIEDFQNEVDVISKMSHRNLVKLLGYCDEKGEQILVYEFVSNGTLRQHIRPDTKHASLPPLTFQQRLEIAVGSAEGLKYLHSFAEPAIIHRDIKCDNILLDNDMQAKVADFGVFKKSPTQPGKEMNTRVVGTPGYVDPEYYQTYKVTTKSDVYSFGVVLLELITGRPPIMEDPSVENESYMVTLSRWATPKIAAGKVETIVDPRLQGAYPRQALNMMAAITAMCVRRLGRDRPEMAEVATRLAEIKYFLKPSSGILEPVMNLFPEDRDDNENLMDIPEEEDDGHVQEFIPGATGGMNPYSTADIAAPVSMVFSDR